MVKMVERDQNGESRFFSSTGWGVIYGQQTYLSSDLLVAHVKNDWGMTRRTIHDKGYGYTELQA